MKRLTLATVDDAFLIPLLRGLHVVELEGLCLYEGCTGDRAAGILELLLGRGARSNIIQTVLQHAPSSQIEVDISSSDMYVRIIPHPSTLRITFAGWNWLARTQLDEELGLASLTQPIVLSVRQDEHQPAFTTFLDRVPNRTKLRLSHDFAFCARSLFAYLATPQPNADGSLRWPCPNLRDVCLASPLDEETESLYSEACIKRADNR